MANNRGSARYDHDLKMNKGYNLMRDLAVSSLLGAGLAGAGHLYKHYVYDRSKPMPEHLYRDVEDTDPGELEEAVEASPDIEKAAGGAWSRADQEWDKQSLPFRLFNNKEEYNALPKGAPSVPASADAIDYTGNLLTTGALTLGSIGGGLLAHAYLGSLRRNKIRNRALREEKKLRQLGAEIVGEEKQAKGAPRADPLTGLTGLFSRIAWAPALAGIGLGAFSGYLGTRGRFADKEREEVVSRIQNFRRQEAESAARDKYMKIIPTDFTDIIDRELNEERDVPSEFPKAADAADTVLGNMDGAYQRADVATRTQMDDTIASAGKDLGSFGGRIQSGMERIVNNPHVRSGMKGGIDTRLGINPQQKTAFSIGNAVSDGAAYLGLSSGPSIAGVAKRKIPEQVADKIDSTASDLNSDPQKAQDFGKGLASGKIDMKSANAPVGTESEDTPNTVGGTLDSKGIYEGAVTKGFGEGVKSNVGSRMSNPISGMAVNFFMQPDALSGAAAAAGGLFNRYFGNKSAASAGPMRDAFEAAGRGIGASPQVTVPIAKVLNDDIVPHAAKGLSNKWFPEGSYGGLGSFGKSMMDWAFSPSDDAANNSGANAPVGANGVG